MKQQPNVLLIHSDSMDGRAMSWLGHPAASTPNLDRLAARGTAFTTACSNSPQCVPSRSSFMTGRHVHEIEAWNNFKGLEPDDPTLTHDAAHAGYQVREIGRRGYDSGGHSLSARLSAWLRSAGIELPQKAPPRAERVPDTQRVREGDWQHVDEAVHWLRNDAARTGQPFLASLGFGQPHPGGGYNTSDHYLGRIPDEHVHLPPDDTLEHPVMRDMSIAKHTTDPLPDDEVLRIRCHYLAMIAELDAMVGQVLEALEAAGLADRTIVVFFADHGDMQMEHRQWLKNAMYEGSTRVPLIFAGPGIAAGHRIDTPVSLVDLRPTLCELIGEPSPARTAGRSLCPGLAGNALNEAPVLSQYHSNMQCTGSFMLREGTWKYIAYPGYPSQLFDLAADPDEMHDLAQSHENLATRMDQRLRELCDYPDIDRRAKANDRQCFSAWRDTVDARTCRRAMESIFHGFTDDHQQLIDRWLEHGDTTQQTVLEPAEGR